MQTETHLSLLLEKAPSKLQAIGEKVLEGIRISKEEGLYLLTSDESSIIKGLADYARKRKAGDIVYHASTLFIHPTNLCELSCPMCSFYAKPGWKTAWFLTPEQIEEKVRANLHHDLTEIHIVGGLWRDCNLDYYKDVFQRIHSIDPKLHIKALTPVEYDFIAKMHNMSVEEVFQQMMNFGLGSLPGGGAEILVEEIRKKVAPGKISSDRYLEIHKIAHTIGLRSNITMLFGHIEEPEHIIEHLDRIRLLQDETNGFQTFIPLKYHEENNALGKRKDRIKPKSLRRIYAISRLMLDNFRNIKVLWNYIGIEEAQEILSWGANDLASTSLDEKIIKMAGGINHMMTTEFLEKAISSIGKIPKKIHSGYNYLQDDQ